MLRAYKYRIYPTDDQLKKIDHSIGVCRLIYNLALDTKVYAYKAHGVKLSSFDLCYQLVPLKKEFPWIAEVDSQALQAAVKKVDVTFKNFYRGSGYPKFKSKRKGVQSLQCPNEPKRVNWGDNTVTIPKIPNIPAKLSRRFEGKIQTCTISRTPTGKYYISMLVKDAKTIPVKRLVKPATTIGIDTGISSFVITSDGRKFEPNRRLKANLQRLKCLQYRASKKQKGSNNRKKANKCVSILHEKVSFSRLDYIHRVTTQLTRDNQAGSIVIEDLNVSGLLKNHKIAQAMSDVSLSKFYEILKYKCEWYGINLIKIGRFDPSSKRCSCCGHIKEKLELSERNWTCEKCNTTHDRDFNAAENIKWYGLQQTIFNNQSGEGFSVEPVELRRLRRTKKQESIVETHI